MPPLNDFTDVLRLGARVHPDQADDQRLAAAAARLSDWGGFPEVADAHGLAPLLYSHFTRAGVRLPLETQQQLLALTLEHRHANKVRFRVLGKILDAYQREGIPVVVLKGAALAHVLYPSPGIRPLADLDLLVERSRAHRAQALLLDLGFWAPPSPLNRDLAGHHHLPAAIVTLDGLLVQVEVHLDALSRDSPGSLSMDRLSGSPQTFSVEGRSAQALGHVDMLYHLCRHAAECAPQLRLIWVADVLGYATRFRDAIPWSDLRARYPFVLNAISLLHLVTALPVDLLEHVQPPTLRALSGVGVAAKPLTEIFKAGRGARATSRDVFYPSDWWLCLYYALDNRAALAWYRWIRHPLHIAHWLVRRARSYVQWRLGGLVSNLRRRLR